MKTTTNNSGQGLVEFALMLAILLLIVIGVLEGGHMVFTKSTLHHAATEGARYGAVNYCRTEDIETVTRERAMLDDVDVDVSVIYGEFGPEEVVVQVGYQFDGFLPVFDVYLEASSQQQVEVRACE
jgi:hypothetical protein